MIKGIGCDIVEIIRVKPTLVNKILSPEEVIMYQGFISMRRKQEFLAGRFAVKEAIVKAIGKIPFSQLVVLNDEVGKPYLISPDLSVGNITISIAHEKAYAIGFCVVE
ncbi:MAG: holo-ACP synthase [Candidatus Izemoplasmatales bacterium]|jgi:holo-[acyl-carrier protein] synthase|nr:holo-ACP synthase [Candidatus Izemoplasmatales bacterium]MDD3865442.1 holo-ACP synthase [Candidatus Izemoplasmatales bacterium]